MAYQLLAANLRHILLGLMPSPEIKLAGQQLRVSNHLDMIGDSLWAINSVIMDANLRAAKEPEIKMWLSDVTAAVVDVENIFEIIQDSFQQPEEQKQEVTTSPISYGSISSTTRHGFLVDLKQIVTSLNCVLSRMVAFDLQIDMVDSMDPNHAEYCSILKQEVVGRDNDIKEILQIIFRPTQGQILGDIYGNVPFFTAITGEPGIGKSILARMVYHHPDVCKVFKHRIWVDVLNSTFLSFDHKQIARECVSHLTGRISSDIDTWNLLHTSIPQRRFLLVLDGFYSITKENNDKLVELKRKLFSLDEDIFGNKVIITCHSTVRTFSRTSYLDEEYNLNTISQEAWTKLFLRYAKQISSSIRMADLLNKAKELYENNKNRIPFEAKKLGSILRHTTMSYYDFQKAPHKYNKLMTVHYAAHELTQIIMYDVLFQPLPLIFHSHRLDMLIAEGTFNYSSNSQQKFQGDVVTWINQLHGTKQVFDAILSYIGKSIYHSRKMVRIPQQCRYACVLVDSNTSTLLTNLEPNIANNLRMLMLYKAKDEMDLQLEKDREASSIKIPALFKNLIILSIIDTHIQQLPNTVSMLRRLRYLNISEKEMEKLPKSICDLHNLCVLSLSHCKKLLKLPEQIHKLTKLQILRLPYCTRLQKLPNSITSLVNLQVLDVEACHWLKELPKDLIYLERLTNLNMSECASLTQIPIGIFRLANLEALTGYIIDHDNSSLILKELQSRTDFKQLHLRHLECMEDQYSRLLLHLKKNIYLESLLLHREWWNKDAMEDGHCIFFQNASILANDFSCLKSLEIISIPVMPFSGELVDFDNFWSLVEVRLVNLKHCKNLPLECIQPSLAILEMSGMDSLTNVDDGWFNFSGLVKLILSEMPSLLKWNLTCPCLQQLTLIQCPKLMELFGFELKNKLIIWLQSELLGQYSASFKNTFKNIEELEIVGCHELRQLPQDIIECKHLKTLSIIRCSKLLSIPDWLQQMPRLEQIFLAGCTRISYIPEKLKQQLKKSYHCPRLFQVVSFH